MLLFDADADGDLDLYIASGGYASNHNTAPYQDRFYLNNGKGNFTDQTQNICPEISKIGMVTDAVWVDLDLDQKNELVLAGEWMPVTVFSIENGKLINTTNKYFDKSYLGWWNTISVGDFNGDKRPDLIIGNTGLNTQFKASEKEPLEMYYRDFDKNGSLDQILTYTIDGKEYPFYAKDELERALPVLKKYYLQYSDVAGGLGAAQPMSLCESRVCDQARHAASSVSATSSPSASALRRRASRRAPGRRTPSSFSISATSVSTRSR